jgi:hypothetical protein
MLAGVNGDDFNPWDGSTPRYGPRIPTLGWGGWSHSRRQAARPGAAAASASGAAVAAVWAHAASLGVLAALAFLLFCARRARRRPRGAAVASADEPPRGQLQVLIEAFSPQRRRPPKNAKMGRSPAPPARSAADEGILTSPVDFGGGGGPQKRQAGGGTSSPVRD